MTDFINSLIILCVISTGILGYWHLKWRARRRIPRDSFGTFFLAGERVGQQLTTHNTWGLGFAFANAVWYFAYLGYNYGIWIFLIQIPWVLAVSCLAVLLRKYLKASRKGTVHGFIADRFGARAGITAAVATLTGYCLNVGFEMFYTSHLLSVAFGLEYIEFLIALLIAAFVAAYCMAGGYYASVITDKYQNFIGSAAILAMIAAVSWSAWHQPAWDLFGSGIEFATPSWDLVAGVVVFAFFFNFVDMANWQSIAANRALPDNQIGSLRRGLLFAAGIQMFMPALAGTWLGVIIRAVFHGLPDDQIIGSGLRAIYGQGSWLVAVLIGFLLFGFLSLTLSAAGSYLVAAMQTLTIDVIKRRDIAKYDQSVDAEERMAIESATIDWVKQKCLIASLVSVVVFAVLYYGLNWAQSDATVFQFQFVMYGAAVTLVPVVLSHLFNEENGRSPRPEGFWSIMVGLACAIIPFILAAFFWNTGAVTKLLALLPVSINSGVVINLTPVFGLLGSVVTFFGVKWLRR